MSRTPAISAHALIKVLTQLGFLKVRSRGSHRRFVHPDGRRTVVPVHKGRDIPKGLLRQIVTIDVGMSMEQFVRLL